MMPSLFTLIDLEDELTVIIGRKTDLRTAEELSRYFRNEILCSFRINEEFKTKRRQSLKFK